MNAQKRQRPRDLLLEAFRGSRTTPFDEAVSLIDKALGMIDATDQQDFLDSLMTRDEHAAMNLTAELWNLLSQNVVGSGPTRDQDLAELALDIHHVQERILAQVAGRAFPDRYRLLGSVITPDSTDPTSRRQGI